jgi:anoctamin-1
VTSLCDNPVTVVFAVVMSFWAALFLEQWKRYSAEINHRWDLTSPDILEESPRPQYLARLKSVKKLKRDFVTNATEPEVPFWSMKFPAAFLSFSVILLLIVIALVAIFGVVLYRISAIASISVSSDKNSTSYAILFTTTTAAIINLVLILVFNMFYEFLAKWMTELELHRTQAKFDNSLTLKIYLLQFVNYYASIFYIAFFKGKFIGTPKAYNRVFGVRQEGEIVKRSKDYF